MQLDLTHLQNKLLGLPGVDDKLRVLEEHFFVKTWLQERHFFASFLLKAPTYERYLAYCLIAIDQGWIIERFYGQDAWASVLEVLDAVEGFYASLGGVVGYQKEALSTLQETPSFDSSIYVPPKIDISAYTQDVQNWTFAAINYLPQLAFLYPIGGAADRLHLQDPATGQELPCACLQFNGETLLEKLFLDLEALEYLYYKLYGKTLRTPVALMTSKEKDNAQHIQRILEEKRYFSRPKDSIRLFCQPSTPVVTKEGMWCLKDPNTLLTKPSGHGAIWKQMQQENLFLWLKNQERTKAVVRQINNPVSRFDYSLMAFIGYGMLHDLDFGFASSHRKVGAKEGMNVLMEKPTSSGYRYALSTIEYCDFAKMGIEESFSSQDTHSQFPANTNILFLDLDKVEKAATKTPFPGPIMNFKEYQVFSNGGYQMQKAARLETMMQNISEEIAEDSPQKKTGLDRVFLTYNERYKTISTTKKALCRKKTSFLDTPERCFYDTLRNMQDLLDACAIEHEKLPSFAKYLVENIPFALRYHPALGPLYSVIAQKIRKGSFLPGSSCVLNIAEVDIENLFLDGSVHIEAFSPTGCAKKTFSTEKAGKCELHHVRIGNRGLIEKKGPTIWKDLRYDERLLVQIEGNGEFCAERVAFQGNVSYFVPENRRLIVYQKNGEIKQKIEEITKASWSWRYEEKKKKVCIKKVKERSQMISALS